MTIPSGFQKVTAGELLDLTLHGLGANRNYYRVDDETPGVTTFSLVAGVGVDKQGDKILIMFASGGSEFVNEAFILYWVEGER